MAATWLADVLRDAGLPVNESLVPNWKSRGHTDGPFAPVGVLGHHTAGPRTGDLPSLATVRDGRPDLAGPLANLMLSRAGVFIPIAAGRAWHAGAADRPASFPWVPKGDGNGYLIGIEAESAGTLDDWTPQQRANYPRGVAALLRHLGGGPARFLGHKEWAPSRKSDPAFWDLNAFRSSVAASLTGAFPIIGAIADAYARPGVGSYLGAPLAPEGPTNGSDPAGRWQPFEHGSIFWHPAVDGGLAHAVMGGIFEAWTVLGREVYTGFPATDESATPDGVGRFNHFAHPDGISIYWSPDAGAHLVRGEIRKAWEVLGWEQGFGYPVTDETPTPNGLGCYNHFTGDRSIYYSPATGAHGISGEIRAAWAAQGWEGGPWGFPAGDAVTVGGTTTQLFQGGLARFDRSPQVRFEAAPRAV